MLVIAARLQRLQRRFGNSQFETREAFNVLDPREPFEADNRPTVLHAERSNCQSLLAPCRARPDRRALSKSLLDEIRFGIDDDLTAQPMLTSNAADQSHVVPIRD